MAFLECSACWYRSGFDKTPDQIAEEFASRLIKDSLWRPPALLNGNLGRVPGLRKKAEMNQA